MELFHLHIPRTGGSSIDTHLQHCGLIFTSGHFHWGDHPPAPDRIFFIVLRDPVERVCSLYDYVRSQPTHKDHRRYMKHSLRELIETAPPSSPLLNGQTRQLQPRAEAFQAMGSDHLVSALKVLSRPDVVPATTECLNEGLALLAKRLGHDISPLTTARNRSERSAIDTRLRDFIQIRNMLDAVLWRSLR